jgi:hypothetical protein
MENTNVQETIEAKLARQVAARMMVQRHDDVEMYRDDDGILRFGKPIARLEAEALAATREARLQELLARDVPGGITYLERIERIELLIQIQHPSTSIYFKP